MAAIHPPAMTSEQSTRLNEIRASILARLQPICADWPREMFEAMVERLAAVTLKYERLGGASPYDRRGTERFITDLKAALERSESMHGEDDPESH